MDPSVSGGPDHQTQDGVQCNAAHATTLLPGQWEGRDGNFVTALTMDGTQLRPTGGVVGHRSDAGHQTEDGTQRYTGQRPDNTVQAPILPPEQRECDNGFVTALPTDGTQLRPTGGVVGHRSDAGHHTEDGTQCYTGQRPDNVVQAPILPPGQRECDNGFVTALPTDGMQLRPTGGAVSHRSDAGHQTEDGTQCYTGQNPVSAVRAPILPTGQRECNNGFVAAPPTDGTQLGPTGSAVDRTQEDYYLMSMMRLQEDVCKTGLYNFSGARRPIPSGLNLKAWKSYLTEYSDAAITDYLEFGWPINFARGSPLIPTYRNHFSASAYPEHVDYYIATELAHGALLGPFQGPPERTNHISPLMTREKKNSDHRRVIVDLSFPNGYSINDGIDTVNYIDGPLTVRLPSVLTMEERVLALGSGSFLYKTDLARGYRQLRIDLADWGLLAFTHRGSYYLDVCPPFGLRSSAMMMVRSTQAVTYIHKLKGYTSIAYIDDFGGAEGDKEKAGSALGALQEILSELGLREAEDKICPPSQVMTWLGVQFNTQDMTMSLPDRKLQDVAECLRQWEGRTRATLKEIQSLFGLLQFVTYVAPPAKLYTNRILDTMREMGTDRHTTLSWGFRRDLKFFSDLLPGFKGVKIIQKMDIPAQHNIELDACLSGCGAICGDQFYGRPFPDSVVSESHPIAHLELLNVVVAVKVWGAGWAGHRVRVSCDNMNAVLAVHSSRTRDPFMQHCTRELHFLCAKHDIDLLISHAPGVSLKRADALSREHLDDRARTFVASDPMLQQCDRIEPDDRLFKLMTDT